MLDGPHTYPYRDDGHEDEGDEDEDPEHGVATRLQLVAGKNLKHQQQEVHPCANNHGLVLNITISFDPAKKN